MNGDVLAGLVFLAVMLVVVGRCLFPLFRTLQTERLIAKRNSGARR